ncbi:MAG: hypothetical protein NZ455_03325 [Bacteroidia bacterium]|nr:hypothetical protein [Bacteroidia bacterium]MDW8346353.1 hypothetical protein [Bacteroidia bacterium]
MSLCIFSCGKCGKSNEQKRQEKIQKEINAQKDSVKINVYNFHLAMDSVYLLWKKDTTQSPLSLIKKHLTPKYERFIVKYINLGKPIDSTDARWLMTFQSYKHPNPSCDISPLNIVLRRLLRTKDKYAFENIGLKKLDSALKKLPANCAEVQKARFRLKQFFNKKDNKSLEQLIVALQELSGFFDWQYMYASIDKAWKHYDIQKAMLPVAKRYHYFYPEKHLPPIILFVSSLEKDAEVVVDTSFIAVSMDFCLGDTFKFYKNDKFPLYLHQRFNFKALPYTIMRRFAGVHFARSNPATQTTFAEIMLKMGAAAYFAKNMIENAEDTLIFSCSKVKMQWAYQNEAFVWKDMLGKLYSKNAPDFRKYVETAPFTKGYSDKSPGQLAMFIGYRVISSYMEKHPNITLPQLMKTQDWLTVLKESGYEPQRPS